MKKHLKPVITSIMVVALGFSVAACGNANTMRKNTVETRNGVHRLQTKSYDNSYQLTDQSGNAIERGMDRTGNAINKGMNKTGNVMERGLYDTEKALDYGTGYGNGYGNTKSNAMGNRMDPTGMGMNGTNGTNGVKGANALSKVARQVGGVKKATVVINGRDAIVGIDVDNKGKKKIIEKQVYNAVKKQYPEFNVHVTSKHDVHQKIIALNTNVTKGHPIKTLANDVALIIRDIGNAVTAPLR